jgi:TolA-binding protein
MTMKQTCATLAVLGATLFGSLQAASVEDAKKLLAAGKTAEVDAALGAMLTDKGGDPAALRVSFDAAMADGRLLTAQVRAAALLKAGVKDPELLWKAALLADMLGEESVALSRYLSFVRAVPGNDERTARALRFLLARGPYPEEYQRFLGSVGGKGGEAVSVGLRQVELLFDAGDPAQGLAVAAKAMAAADAPNLVSAVHATLWNAAEKNRTGADARYLAPLRILLAGGQPDRQDIYRNMGDRAFRSTEGQSVEDRAELLIAMAEGTRGPLGWEVRQHFGLVRQLKDEERRLAWGKRFLATEAKYPSQDDQQAVLQTICDIPEVFFVKGKELISADDLMRRFDAMVKDRPDLGRAWFHRIYSYLDQGRRVEFVKARPAIAFPDAAAECVTYLGKDKAAEAEALIQACAKLQGPDWLARCNVHTVYRWAEQKDLPRTLAAARSHLMWYPVEWNADHFIAHCVNRDVGTPAERLAPFLELAQRGGANPRLQEFIGKLDNDKKNWGGQPHFEEFKKAVAAAGEGKDAAFRAVVKLYSLPWNQGAPDPAYYATAKTLADSLQQVPTGDAERDLSIVRAAHRHISAVWGNRDAVVAAADLWLPHFGKGSGAWWPPFIQRLQEYGANDQLAKWLDPYSKLVKANPADSDGNVWYRLAWTQTPAEEKRNLLDGLEQQAGGWVVCNYVIRHQGLTPAQGVAAIAKVFDDPRLLNDDGGTWGIINWLCDRSTPEVQPPLELARSAWKWYQARSERSGSLNGDMEWRILAFLARTGRMGEPAGQEMLKAWRGFKPERRSAVEVANTLTTLAVQMPRETDLAALKPGYRFHFIFNEVLPALEQVPEREAPGWWINPQLTGEIWQWRGWPAALDGPRKSAERLTKAVVRLAAAGANGNNVGWDLCHLADLQLAAALAAKDWPAAFDDAELVGRFVPPDSGQLGALEQWNMDENVKRLKDAGAIELGFRYADRIASAKGLGKDKAERWAQIRSDFARQMPELGVDRNDPFYDLIQAQRSLQLGNEMRAWQLAQPRLKLLQERWQDLDQNFVAWAADQMRKSKQSKQALEFCMTLLLREADFEAETAGRIILTKGDIYLDLQNNPAARIEYEGLRNNRRYRDIEAGTKARYRLISLLIATNDWAKAEEQILQLTDSERSEVRAEGWYLRGRLAWEQKNWEDASKHLEECFKISIDHVEGRLLEGELKLKLPGKLRDTDVQAGEAQLGTVIIPGQPFNLKLNDTNLAISQGNAAIPVVVRTAPGGDEERFSLNPSPNNRSQFAATIPTQIGKVQKGDLTLQVRGDDEVTYQIDPAFQKAHGIEYGPKPLAVRYAAKLVASAGELLDEDEARRRQQERMERASRNEVAARDLGRDPRTIRPGSPIYIQVTDLAADLGDQADKLTVDARTTGGAEVKGIVLTETGPHTGIFRGSVGTAVPGARVAASDSEEGRDPAQLIVAGNQQSWSSLPDGKRPKWLEVDTMGATLIAAAGIELPDAKAIRTVRLLGRQFGSYEELATWPRTAGGARAGGLKAEVFEGADLGGRPIRSEAHDLIDFGQGIREVIKGRNDNFSVRWTGAFVPKFTEEYTISTESDDGVRLWLGDRQVINNWNGHGNTIDRASIRLVAGKPQPFKLEWFQGGGGWRIALWWASASQPAAVIPAAAFTGAADDADKRRGLGGIATVVIPGSLGADPSLLSLREAFNGKDGLDVAYRPDPAFDRAATPAKDKAGWQIGRSEGLFALPDPGEYEFRFTHQPEAGASQVAWLVIDQIPVTGGPIGDKSANRTGKIKLAPGVHRIELYVQDNAAKSVATIGFRRAGQGEFQAMPPDWFSWIKHAELADGVVPAVISPDAKGLTATFPQPLRIRSLRWVFEDFTGNAVQARSLSVTDAEAGAILPAKAAAAGSDGNLLVAPGEHIEVSYADQRRIKEDEAVISTKLNSSFAKGDIAICNEDVYTNPENGGRRITHQPVRRCRPGDALQIIVADNDLDLTEERDQVKIRVETSSGEKLELTALESNLRDPSAEGNARHAGTFSALLKIGTQTGKDTIGIKPGDLITVSFQDAENTSPGVPCDRTFTAETAGTDEPAFIVYRTATRSVPDDSAEAKARAERMRMRGKAVDRSALVKDIVEAVHPDRLKTPPVAGAPVVVDVGAPLLFEVRWPSAALNSGSVVTVEAVAASELERAKAENREAVWTQIPAGIVPISGLANEKGFEARIDRAHATSRDLLQEGVFAGILRFQLGSPGDPVDELVVKAAEFTSKDELARSRERYRLPTIVVKGSDAVRLRIRPAVEAPKPPPRKKKAKEGEAPPAETPVEAAPAPAAKEWTCEVQLRSDGRIDLLDESYAAQTPQIHLGDAFHVQVADPDRDTSDKRDEIEVEVRTPAGATVKRTLAETLPHSGVFAAKLRPVYAGDAKPAAPAAGGKAPAPAPAPAPAAVPAEEGPAVPVNFGDELVFTYRDPIGLAGDSARDVAAKGRIAFGADGEQAAFTKRFNDPDMAVKTQFLIAEALFEMAKEHRKIKQDASQKLAADEIARGKRVLEEALRDYPTTTLVSQGEFLLANLAEELAEQFGDDEKDKRNAALNEAETRYAAVISRWPDSEFAPRAQFKIALCQEKRGNFDQASESFVRVIYLYPENDLAADSTLRLGNYYYKQKQFPIASKIFAQFQRQRPLHPKAPQALFLAAQSNIKALDLKLIEARDMGPTVDMLETLVKQYPDAKDVRPVAMYWLGDVYSRLDRFQEAYRIFKKLTWDYPESKEAKMARGRLTEKAFDDVKAFEKMGDSQ